METERICPSCHKVLPPDVPLGLCPECLIKSGFPTGTEPGKAPASGFVPPTVEEIAKLFPQFEVLGFIGKGGMGAVYKARQPGLDRLVALKVLPPVVGNDPGFVERFNREARALARLSHPNIVVIYDFGKTGDLPYLVMEYVDGTNLREIERMGTLSAKEALEIVPQICEALQFAHSEGIVHRDIKPENLLIDKKGRVKIADFGIAKILDVPTGKVSLTGAKDVVGTPHYMAPEQIEKPQSVDHRADIYSLGVVFYEMLTGELPLGKFAPPSKKVQVDVRLDEVVLHTLEKEPERRYQHASQLKTDVETIATTAAPPPKIPVMAQPPKIGTAAPVASVVIIAPAIALMVTGVLKFISGATAPFSGWPGYRITNDLFGHLGFVPGMIQLASSLIFMLIPAMVIIFGAIEMVNRRNYAWSMVAAIVAILFYSFIGFVAGIWALIVLLLPGTRMAFGRSTGQPTVAKWGWVLGVVGGGGLFLIATLNSLAIVLHHHHMVRVAQVQNSAEPVAAPAEPATNPAMATEPERPERAMPAARSSNPNGGWNLEIADSTSSATSVPTITVATSSGNVAVMPSGTPPTYQLYKNGTNPTEGAASTPAVPNLSAPPGTTYVVITNGTMPPSYQWYYSNTNVTTSNQVLAAGTPGQGTNDFIVQTLNPNDPNTKSITMYERADAGEATDFSKSFAVEPGGTLTMTVDRGDVRITGGDQNEVKVHVEREVTHASDGDVADILKQEHVVVEETGNEISITAQDPPHLHPGGFFAGSDPNLQVHYDISVPRRFGAQVETAGGNITVASVIGGMKLKTAGGNLDCKDVSGNVEGRTGGGNIFANGCKGRLQLKTSGGNITFEGFSGTSIEAETGGGEVDADFAAAPRSDSHLHTSGGSIRVHLPMDAAMTLDAHTDGGVVRSDVPVQTQGLPASDTLNGTINGGGPTLKVETSGGNIEISKR